MLENLKISAFTESGIVQNYTLKFGICGLESIVAESLSAT